MTSLKPSQKSAADPLAALRAKVSPYDIKLALDYLPGTSTHVVAAKRNTAASLSALIEGRPIVTDEFVDALATACAARPATDADDGADAAAAALPSLLEDDFVANWPVEMGYLPPPGREPVTRGPEFFAPRPDRAGVFDGYTFVFVDAAQFAALQPVVAVGGGKAVLFEAFRAGETAVEDFVRYVKGKGHGEWVAGEGHGPIVVRWAVKDGDEWGKRFCSDADLALGQRSVLQNEFLDAILVNDASGLRKALEFEESMPSSSARAGLESGRHRDTSSAAVESPTMLGHNSAAAEVPVQHPKQQADPSQVTSTIPPRRQRRVLTQSRYEGFDDFNQPAAPSGRTGIQDSDDVLSDDSIRADDHTATGPSKKRPAERSDDSISPDGAHRTKRSRANNESKSQNVVDEILPAATAMRRKKMRDGALEHDNGGTTRTKTAEELAREADKARLEQARQRRDRGAEIDVNEEVRRQRQREMEDARAEEERLRQGMTDVDVAGLRDVAVVEEMSLPARLASSVVRPDSNTEHPVNGREWKAEWNGRKNYKGFRPKRAADSPQPLVPSRSRIIVRLEEVKKKAFGIGDEYWGESRTSLTQASNQTARKPSQAESQRASASRVDDAAQQPGIKNQGDEDDEDESQFRRSRRSAKSQSSAAKSQPQSGAKSTPSSAPTTALGSSRNDSNQQHPTHSDEHPPPAQTQPESAPPMPPPPPTDHSLRSRVSDTQWSKTASSEMTRPKRKAGGPTGAERAAKKGRVGGGDDSEESDDDGLRFRRRRK